MPLSGITFIIISANEACWLQDGKLSISPSTDYEALFKDDPMSLNMCDLLIDLGYESLRNVFYFFKERKDDRK